MTESQTEDLRSFVQNVLSEHSRIGADELFEKIQRVESFRGRVSRNDLGWIVSGMLATGAVRYDNESYLTAS